MKLREWKNIESEFFELDEPNKIAKMTLHYHSPKELFDPHGETRLPLLKPETMAYLKTMLGYAPPKYKVELTLRFDDLGPYSEQQIADVVIKNSVLELKSIETATRQRDRLAYAFLAAGALCFFVMFMLRFLWPSESIWNELIFYLLDVITTVFAYEALTILSLERREKLDVIRRLRESVSAVRFEERTY